MLWEIEIRPKGDDAERRRVGEEFRLLTHAAAEPVRAEGVAVDFRGIIIERAFEPEGGEAELIGLAGRDHFTASAAGGEADGPWVPRALDWMARHAS